MEVREEGRDEGGMGKEEGERGKREEEEVWGNTCNKYNAAASYLTSCKPCTAYHVDGNHGIKNLHSPFSNKKITTIAIFT